MNRQPSKSKNILGMQVYSDQFFGVALDNLRRTLLSAESIDNIEIEVKYAELKYFSNCYNEYNFRGIDSAVKDRMVALINYQSNEYFRGLQMVSKQNIVFLNPLGRNTYQLNSGFDEASYRKFYHIRDFLTKMSRHNEANNYLPRPSNRQEGPINIYHELSLNNFNHHLKMVEEDELRLDLYVKDGVVESLRGRYSYSTRSGWKKTEKVPLCVQMDFMLSERTFRFAINREVESDVSAESLQQISRFLKGNPKMTDIRLKRLLRVTKGEVSEYALSEIYNINDQNKNVNPEFFNKITSPPAELNPFLRKVFINFYSIHERNFSKFQIESEFTKVMTRHLKKLLAKDQLSEVKHELESAIEELYALYFCDHATKVKEVPWLNAKVKEMPETRLENQYGNYMRQELYENMRNSQ